MDDLKLILMRIAEYACEAYHLVEVQVFTVLDLLLAVDGPGKYFIEAVLIPFLQLRTAVSLELSI